MKIANVLNALSKLDAAAAAVSLEWKRLALLSKPER